MATLWMRAMAAETSRTSISFSTASALPIAWAHDAKGSDHHRTSVSAVYGHADHSRFEARFDQVTQPASRRLNMKMKAGRDNFSACFAASARPAQWNRIVLVGVVTLLLVGHAHAQAPSIAGITPNTGGVGEYMAISGSNFGATQGTSTVTFNGTPATVVNSWSNTHIATYVPSG